MRNDSTLIERDTQATASVTTPRATAGASETTTHLPTTVRSTVTGDANVSALDLKQADRQRAITQRAMLRKSFCTLATSSAANRPHVAGVIYVMVDGALYINTLDTSVKVRNIRHNPRVAVSIPARKLPFFPPFCVQFQGTAEVCSPHDPAIVRLLDDGSLKRISSHGELDQPGSCFIRVIPARNVTTFGVGVPLRQILSDPLAMGRSVELFPERS